MPPGPAYNWLCVAYSALNILSHAAHHRAAQVTQRAAARATTAADTKSRQEPHSTENDVKLTNAPSNEASSMLNTTPSEGVQLGISDLQIDKVEMIVGRAPHKQPPIYSIPARNLQSSKVPSSRIGRLFHYGGEHIYVSSSIGILILHGRSCGITRLWRSLRTATSNEREL